MKKIFFTKMQALGNDFVILDWEEYQEIELPIPELAKSICERKFGVGADGLIVVIPESQKADLSWSFYNSDGTVAKMNGNAIRCFAKYVLNKGYIDKVEFSVETDWGIFSPKINEDGTVTLDFPIEWSGCKDDVEQDMFMTGPAEFSFEGVFFHR